MSDRITDDRLVGKYFHALFVEPDGCQVLDWRGLVTARPAEGLYLVQPHESGHKRPHEVLVPVADMTSWRFYSSRFDSDAASLFAGWHRRAAEHSEHVRQSPLRCDRCRVPAMRASDLSQVWFEGKSGAYGRSAMWCTTCASTVVAK